MLGIRRILLYDKNVSVLKTKMDIFLAGLKQLNVVVGSVLVVYAWSVLVKPVQRLLFLTMMLFFTVSTVLFFPQGEVNEWLKHAPFYIGQVLFLLLMYVLDFSQSATGQKRAEASLKSIGVTAIGVGATEPSAATARDSGLQHILVVPLFIVLGFTLLIKMTRSHSKQACLVIGCFLLASASLTMIHIFEYFVESKDYVPFLQGSGVEMVELFWFYLSCVLFWLALKRYSLLTVTSQNVG